MDLLERRSPCPLCEQEAQGFVRLQITKRDYFRCSNCDYLFVDPAQRLASEEERSRYDLHQNDPGDTAYRDFLSQLTQPLLELMESREKFKKGLDFGCGPGPTLSKMLEEEGMEVSLYDLFYFPDKMPLQQTYDFVTATEVIEHIRDPKAVIEIWLNLLRPGGVLGLMTDLFQPDQDLETWHYVRDPTHIGFFSEVCMTWVAERYDIRLVYCQSRVAIFQK